MVEDSPSGVEAALAAAMRAFAFSDGVVPAERLQRQGVIVFDSMSVLPELLMSASYGT